MEVKAIKRVIGCIHIVERAQSKDLGECALQVVLYEVVPHPLHDSTALGWLDARSVGPHQHSRSGLHHTHPTIRPLSPQHQPTCLTPQEDIVLSTKLRERERERERERLVSSRFLLKYKKNLYSILSH